MRLKETAEKGDRPETAQTEGGDGKKGKKKKKKKTEVDKKAIEDIEQKSKNVEEEIGQIRGIWEQEKAALIAEKENV
jgi:hypothetical protein